MILDISFLFDLEAVKKAFLIQLLREHAKSFFKDRVYSPLVENLTVEVVSFKKPFRQEGRKRPLYVEEEIISPGKGFTKSCRLYHFLFINIPLPDEFITCPYEESLIIVRDAVIGYFRETPLPVKLRKSFDMERFLADLTTFFKRIDLRTGMWKTEGQTV